MLCRLQRFDIGHKALEGVAAALAGIYAGSVALIGFALVSGADLARTLKAHNAGTEAPNRKEALRSQVIGLCALGAGGELLLHSAHSILSGERPAPSLLGATIVEVSILITIVRFWAARRLIPPPHFDFTVALRRASVRLLLALSVLTGLTLHAAFGLWRADPLSALLIAAFFLVTGARLYSR